MHHPSSKASMKFLASSGRFPSAGIPSSVRLQYQEDTATGQPTTRLIARATGHDLLRGAHVSVLPLVMSLLVTFTVTFFVPTFPVSSDTLSPPLLSVLACPTPSFRLRRSR